MEGSDTINPQFLLHSRPVSCGDPNIHSQHLSDSHSLPTRTALSHYYSCLNRHVLEWLGIMAKVEGFGTLTKKQEDLFRLGYYYKSFACATLLTTAEKVTFKARAAQKTNSNILASSSIKVAQTNSAMTTKRRTDGLQQYSLEYSPNADLKLKGEIKKTETTKEKSVSVEYRQPEYALKLVLADPVTAIKASATFEKDGKGAGFDGKFEPQAERVTAYNAAAWMSGAKYALVVKHLGSDRSKFALGDFVVSYFHEASVAARVAALVKHNVPRNETSIEFGGDYKYTPSLVVRGKVNSAGYLGLGLTHQLAAGLKLGLASQFDLKKVRSTSLTDYHFGLRLDFST